MKIRIKKTENSKLKYIDLDNIPFGKYTSDHMFVMGRIADKRKWLVPVEFNK